MHSKQISIIVETAYLLSTWCEDKLQSIKQEAARFDYRLNRIDPDGLDEYLNRRSESCVMVLGTDRAWIKKTVHALFGKGISVLLICAEPMELYGNIFVIAPDRSEMMMECMAYLASAGRKRTALFGFNPSATSDILRKKVFLTHAADYGLESDEKDIYTNCGAIGQCFEAFAENARRYNAVICANDAAAVYLIRKIGDCGIKVPEDLFIIGNGNTRLGAVITPSLTTVTLNYDEVGRQAVHLYRYLSGQPSIHSVYATVACEVVARQSTAFFQPVGREPKSFYSQQDQRDSFFFDPDIRQFFLVENLLCGCDGMDLEIIEGLMNKVQYERLAEELYISVDALRYRIKKMFQTVDTGSREEFISLLMQYHINFKNKYFTPD